MTAELDVRAKRRYDELIAKGQPVSLEEIKKIADIDLFIAIKAAEVNHKMEPSGGWAALIDELESLLLDKLHYTNLGNIISQDFLKLMLDV